MGEFVDEFWHLLSDPAHTAVEFVFVGIDYLIIHTVVRKWRKHFHRDIGVSDGHGLTP